MLRKLLLLSFIEGATVMAAELCGAKLLAPVFGSSLYVWASVMGITLLALAMGYFFGGYLSAKANATGILFSILNVASIFILLMPLLSRFVVPVLLHLPFLLAVMLSTMVLLFFPVFFLGASSPLFIFIQTKSLNESGRVSGTVYAVSTAGGILATFLCGFYLIPEIGLRACLLTFGGLLFISNGLVFKVFKSSQFILLLIFAGLNFYTFKPARTLLFQSEGIMGHLEIEDVTNKSGDTIRYMKLNTITQTEMNKRSNMSVSEYIMCLDSTIPVSKKPAKALVLGLGGGVIATLLYKKNYHSDCVEFDERIIHAAKKFFYLPEGTNTFHSDARYYLNNNTKKYDLILFDLFRAEEQPSHVITSESLEKIKNALNDSGLLVINWHGFIKPPLGVGTSVLYQTLKKSDFNVQLFSTGKNENYRNLIFCGTLNAGSNLNKRYLLDEQPTLISVVNTDDEQVLEKYNARANLMWRKSYMAYYR